MGVEPKLGGYSAGVFTMIEQFSHGGGEQWAPMRIARHTQRPSAVVAVCTAGTNTERGLYCAMLTTCQTDLDVAAS